MGTFIYCLESSTGECMKALGVPRVLDLLHPDKATIKLYGLSATDRCARVDRGKNSSRRIWKKKHRATQRGELYKELCNENGI
jgi:hypothetical protein